MENAGGKMNRILTKEEWYRKGKRRRKILTVIAVILMIAIFIFTVLLISKLAIKFLDTRNPGIEAITITLPGEAIIKQQYLTPNQYSRPQTPLKSIRGIVIHYTANPGTSAENNLSYFQGLARKKTTYASSHYIIGLEGEILQCIPLTEIAYASNDRNKDTISIECCHSDETGEFNKETYNSLVVLAAALCVEFNIEEDDLLRHFDVTGKLCPLYYVDHEDAWMTLKADIMEEVKQIESQNVG